MGTWGVGRLELAGKLKPGLFYLHLDQTARSAVLIL